MLHIILSRLVWCVVLMILQVFLFNHVHLWGYATPLCYVYFLLILPADTPRWLYILSGFLLGLFADLFSNTPGVGAASLCAVGLVTPWLLSAFAPKDRDEEILLPSAVNMEWGRFLRYALSATFLHCALFYTLEAFSFSNWQQLLLRIVSSTLLTFLIIVVLEMIRSQDKKK